MPTDYATFYAGDHGKTYLNHERESKELDLDDTHTTEITNKITLRVPKSSNFKYETFGGNQGAAFVLGDSDAAISGIKVDRTQTDNVTLDKDSGTVQFTTAPEANGNRWVTVHLSVPKWSSVKVTTVDDRNRAQTLKWGIVTDYAGLPDASSKYTTVYINFHFDARSLVLDTPSIQSASELKLYLRTQPDLAQSIARALSLVRCKCPHLPDAVGITQLASMSEDDDRNYTLQAEVVNAFATLAVACYFQLDQITSRSWKAYSWTKEIAKMIGASTTFFQRVDFVNGKFKRRRKRTFDWT